MKSKSFFQKYMAFFIFFILLIFSSCSTFKYDVGQLTGENDLNFLNHLYPINSDDPKNPINETTNFCSFFYDESGVLYSLTIELSKLNLNNTEFWFYELSFSDYSPIQTQDPKKPDPNAKPIVIKFTQTSINPMTPIKIKENTISLGKNKFVWKNDKLLFEIKDKKNSIKVSAQLFPKNNFFLFNSPFLLHSAGKSVLFFSVDLNTNCEYDLYYTEKQRVKKKLTNGIGILYKSWGNSSISEYELHFLNFSKIKLGKIEINPPENLFNKSYIIFSIPKSSFYSILEISKENNLPIIKQIQNFVPENDYRYSKLISDKNRRYPSYFSILLNNFLIRFNPLYDKSTVEFFTHDSWFGVVPLYDAFGNLIGLGFSNIYEYSRMKISQ